MHPSTSVTLLEKLRDPAERARAWDRFAAIYAPLLYRLARRLGRNPDDAADLVQDVLVILLRTLPEFRYDPGRSFRAWLKTVVLNRWRETARRKTPVATDPRRLPEPAVPDPLDGFTEAEHTRHLVHAVLPRLRGEFPPSEWAAFERYAVEGRPATAVAAELGVSVATVYAARSRVLKRLRDELAGLLD